MAKQFINPEGLSKSPAYSQAVSVGGGKTVYISGQVALDSAGEIVGKDDLSVQTEKVFENLKLVLEAVGATFNDIVKANYYVKNFQPEHLPIIREIRGRYLPKENPPASTLVGVQFLAEEDFLIEVEAVAVIQ